MTRRLRAALVVSASLFVLFIAAIFVSVVLRAEFEGRIAAGVRSFAFPGAVPCLQTRPRAVSRVTACHAL